MKLVKKFKNPAGALTGEISTANSTFGVDENGYIYYNKNGSWYPSIEASRHYGDTYNERAMPYDPRNEFRSSHYPLSTIQAYGPGTLYKSRVTNGKNDGVVIIKGTPGTAVLDASLENGRRNDEATLEQTLEQTKKNKIAWEKTKNYSNDLLGVIYTAANAPFAVVNAGGLIKTGQDLIKGKNLKLTVGNYVGGKAKVNFGDSSIGKFVATALNTLDPSILLYGGGRAAETTANWLGAIGAKYLFGNN